MKRYKTVLGIVALCCVIALSYALFYQNPNSKSSVFEYVQTNSQELKQFSKSVIENNTVEPILYNKWEGSCYPNAGMVQFVVSSGGLGSSQTYKGFYYSSEDIPLGFQGAELEFTKEDIGWKWTEVNGDNFEYTEKIVNNWYWFEAGF